MPITPPSRRATPSPSPPRTPPSPRGCTPVRAVCTPLWKRKRLSAQMLSSTKSRTKQNSQHKPNQISRVSTSASPSSSQPEAPGTQESARPGSIPIFPSTSCATALLSYKPYNQEQSASTQHSPSVEAVNLANREPVPKRMV